MKKVLLALAVFAAIFAVKADYLYWQVNDATYTTEDGYAARLMGGTEAGSFSALANTDGDTVVGIPGSYFTEANSSYSYYIEIVNYDSAAQDWATVAKSDTFTYSQLAASNYIIPTLGVDVVTPVAGFGAGASFSGGEVPEPTSGLMLVLGLAMVGLKRKKV